MTPRTPLLMLLFACMATTVTAQQSELLIGGGATFTGADFADVGKHAVLGFALASGGVLGGRADALYADARGGHFFALNIDATAHFVSDPAATLRPYALAGGSLLADSDNAFAGINGGLGLRIRAGQSVGMFVEGRFFHVFGASSLSDDLILASAGVAVHL